MPEIDRNSIKAGQVIILTEGEYSDYHIVATLIANKPFQMSEAVKGLEKENPSAVYRKKSRYDSSTVSTYCLASYLVEHDYATKVTDSPEWHSDNGLGDLISELAEA